MVWRPCSYCFWPGLLYQLAGIAASTIASWCYFSICLPLCKGNMHVSFITGVLDDKRVLTKLDAKTVAEGVVSHTEQFYALALLKLCRLSQTEK